MGMMHFGFMIQTKRAEMWQDLYKNLFMSFNQTITRFETLVETGRYEKEDLRIVKRWNDNPETDVDMEYDYDDESDFPNYPDFINPPFPPSVG